MRVPQLTLDMLTAVIALSQTKSFEKAGTELKRTPSGVQKRISALNEMFGTRLFTKAGDSEILTRHGEVFFQGAFRTVESALQLEDTLAAFVDIQERHLHVGHSTHLSSRFLAMLHMLDLVGSHNIRITHKSGLTAGTVQDVLNGRLHAGFGYLPIVHSDLRTYTLCEEPVMVCLWQKHRLAVRPSLGPQDLEGEPVIAVARAPLPVLHQEIEEFFQSFDVSLKIVADSFGVQEATAMVEQKIGICFVAASAIKPPLVAKPLSPQALFRRSGLIVRADNEHPVLDLFVQEVQRRTASWRRNNG